MAAFDPQQTSWCNAANGKLEPIQDLRCSASKDFFGSAKLTSNMLSAGDGMLSGANDLMSVFRPRHMKAMP